MLVCDWDTFEKDSLVTLDNTMIVLGLSLGKVATIGIGATVLVCEGLGRDLLVDHMVDRGGGIWGRGIWGWGSMDQGGMVGDGGMVGNRPVGNCWAKELRGSKGTAKSCQGNENLGWKVRNKRKSAGQERATFMVWLLCEGWTATEGFAFPFN